MKWIVVEIFNSNYSFLTNEEGEILEFDDLDEAYRTKSELQNGVIVPVDIGAAKSPMIESTIKAINQYERAEYWKKRALLEEKSKTYYTDPSIFRETLRQLNKLKEKEQDYV